MYMVRTEFMVRGGYVNEFEADRIELGNLRKGMPGYLGQALLNSFSHPSKYVATGRYENAEAYWVARKNEAVASHMKSRPAGQASVTLQEAYEGVFDVDAADPAATTCEVFADWTLDQRPGVFARFEASRRALFELRKHYAKGFGSGRVRRSAGTPGKYLLINFYTTAEDARAAQGVPEIAAFVAAHPYTLYAAAPPTLEAYHVISRMPGQ